MIFLFIYSPWQEYSNSKTENKEKDLCSLVENILFVVMWRGVNIHNKSCWKVYYISFYNFVIIKMSNGKYYCNGFIIYRNAVKLWRA